jgi:hypothetical protein
MRARRFSEVSVRWSRQIQLCPWHVAHLKSLELSSDQVCIEGNEVAPLGAGTTTDVERLPREDASIAILTQFAGGITTRIWPG